MEQLVIQKNRTCGGCYLENNNKCYWFVKRNNESKSKYIPADVFSKGCSKYELNIESIEESELLSKLIDVFDGEIIGNKFTPPKKKTYYNNTNTKTQWWKKKSKHKYTERKDW